MKKFKLDKPREECGVFGISDHDDASALVALGLHALQHRGQEGCGVASFDGEKFYHQRKQHHNLPVLYVAEHANQEQPKEKHHRDQKFQKHHILL